MIRHRDVNLPDEVVEQFKKWQEAVDAETDYPKKVALAKKTWNAGGFKKNKSFLAMRQALLELSNGVQRCAYCEDSKGNQVEHIRPKDWYPGQVFDTGNYVMACGDCNAPKNNNFSVLPTGQTKPVELKRKKGQTILEPPLGEDVLINPRVDDPFQFLKLNIVTPDGNPGTFKFKEQGAGWHRARAKYTIKLLRLNVRDELVEARAVAYESFIFALFGYQARKQAGESGAKLKRARQALRKMPHQTVLEEIKRQRSAFVELETLFTDCPELL